MGTYSSSTLTSKMRLLLVWLLVACMATAFAMPKRSRGKHRNNNKASRNEDAVANVETTEEVVVTTQLQEQEAPVVAVDAQEEENQDNTEALEVIEEGEVMVE